MSRKTVIVDTFRGMHFGVAVSKGLIVVYTNPSDFPGKFVARLWALNQATPLAVVKDTLAEIRAAIPTERFVRLDPAPDDDPVITEIWL